MITWDETKRSINLSRHKIDLADLETVFDYPMLTKEDNREAYGEMRLQSLCWYKGRVVFLVWTDREQGAHLISCRYSEKHETRKYIKTITP